MRSLKALIALALLLGATVVAEAQGQTLPPNTVLGRTGITAGPAQAIPFSTLGPLLAPFISGGGGGAVSSVSNSDGTLMFFPTTGAVMASLALGHSNTWTTGQSFTTITASSLTSGITSCVQASSAGVLSLTGSPCGSGSGAVNTVVGGDGSLTISPTTGSVVAALNIAHTNTWSAAQTFTNINFTATAGNGLNDQTAVTASLASFWPSNGPAIVHRMNRLMVGEASTANLSPPGNTWLDVLIPGASELGQITSIGTIFAGIYAAARTSDAVTAFGSASNGSAGGYFFGVNDNNTAGNIALGLNAVGINNQTSLSTTLGSQMDMNNSQASCASTATSPFCASGPTTIAMLVTSGAFSSRATQDLSAGVVFLNGYVGGPRFKKGIVFYGNVLNTGEGAGSNGVAVEMYPGQTLRWNDGTHDVQLWMGGGGTFSIHSAGVSYSTFTGTCTIPPTVVQGLIIGC